MYKITLYIIFRREFIPRHWGFIPISSGRNVGGRLTWFCWTLAQSVLKGPKLSSAPCPEEVDTCMQSSISRNTVWWQRTLQSFLCKAQKLLCLSKATKGVIISVYRLQFIICFFLSYAKFTSATGTNEEGLWVSKISPLKWELRKTEGNGCGKIYPWMMVSQYRAHRQGGLSSHPPEVNQLLGNPSRQKPQAVGLCDLKSKPCLEAVSLNASFTDGSGRGTYWEVNNGLDGLFFPLYEVIILYNKKQVLKKSCVKNETQLGCSEICLINWLHIVTSPEEVSTS